MHLTNQENIRNWQPLHHGGNLADAVKLYGGEQKDWLDLSTGISPWSCPIPDITLNDWQHLPPITNELLQVAAEYYQCDPAAIIVTPGSQLAIRLLPRLFNNEKRVAIPLIGYQEHAYSWASANHSVLQYQDLNELNELIDKKLVTHAVVISPNNPMGTVFNATTLSVLAKKLSGVLIVDEAFMDIHNSASVCRQSDLSNIIVLRSLGKFFGLAGARVGFLISHHRVKNELTHLLSPWTITTPAQKIAEAVLHNSHWQTLQCSRIKQHALNLNQLLKSTLPNTLKVVNAELFNTIIGDSTTIKRIHQQFAKQKIWTRLGDEKKGNNWLRISLPGPEAERFNSAVQSLT